jgi:SsrA-binding protein
MAKQKGAAVKKPGVAVISVNRKVRHQYEVIKSFEAGLVLQGSEIKSLREGDVQWADAHGRFDDRTGELWLCNMYIGEYRQASYLNHRPTAPRKLLLHRRELESLRGMLQTKGVTLVPRQLHFRRGFAKCELCLVRGKKQADKRQDLVRRTQQREAERDLAHRYRG